MLRCRADLRESQEAMTNDMYRIGVVGASSLAGERAERRVGTVSLAASDFVLLDVEEAVGQVTAAADEVSFIQRLEASSFERMDFVFFAGEPETTKKHWQDARRGGGEHCRSDVCTGG